MILTLLIFMSFSTTNDVVEDIPTRQGTINKMFEAELKGVNQIHVFYSDGELPNLRLGLPIKGTTFTINGQKVDQKQAETFVAKNPGAKFKLICTDPKTDVWDSKWEMRFTKQID